MSTFREPTSELPGGVYYYNEKLDTEPGAGHVTRSLRPDVRNPLLSLPGFAVLRTLPPDIREGLRVALMDIRRDASERAQKSWRSHKAPMALYWKCVAVYAGHTARALR